MGFGGTLTGWGSYKLYIDDPEKGEVGFVGETFEAGMPGLVCTRLKVVDHKVSEVEALITRKETAAGFTRPDGLTDPKVAAGLAGFFEDVPEAEQESRKDLIAQTDRYFDGIEKSSGGIVPFAPNVIRKRHANMPVDLRLARKKWPARELRRRTRFAHLRIHLSNQPAPLHSS